MVRMLLASFTYHPVQRWGPVSPHGVGTAVGFLAGAILMARRAEPRGVPRAEVYNAVTWGAVGALIGARGFYVLGHIHQFTSVRDVIAVWQGGLTMFGGFLGGLALGLWYLRRHGYAIVPALDAAAPGFAIGVLIGRIGDIIIADHLGRTTHFVLGYKIPNARLAPGYGPPTYVPGAIVHHTALYDFAGTLVLLGFLFWLERRKPATGSLFAAFSLWYGLQRFFIDFTRNRQLIESHFFGLSGSQWAGLAFAIAGAVALIRLRGRRLPEVPQPAAAPVGVLEPTRAMPVPMPEELPPPAAVDPVEASLPVVEQPPIVPQPSPPSEPPPPVQPAEPGPAPPETLPTPETPPTPPTPETPPTPPTEPTPQPPVPPEVPAEPAPEAAPDAPGEPPAESPPASRPPDEETTPGA
jgi:prolipoprotein diacylglyceryl transferase